MYNELKQRVYEANMLLPKHGLVTFTWGNVSEVDRENNVMAIKPSGVEYEKLRPEHIVVLDLITGEVVDGNLNPSSDTPTHLELYRSFKNIGGVVHTHSPHGTAWAQAGRAIPAYGTTHADYFYGDIPCTRPLTKDEVESAYELNTGKVIVETFKTIDPDAVPGVVVSNHAPFTWGTDADNAVHNAVVLEEVAKMAFMCESINPDIKRMPGYVLDKHYMRKHGKDAYYGQGDANG